MSHQEIYVLNKRLKLRHSATGFKTSMDSVLLAAACPAVEGDHILDMGCGVGGAGLCVLTRVAGAKLSGVEIQGEHAELARQNAEANNMAERAEFITADIQGFRREKAFHHIICNPPYLEAGKHLRSPSEEKATAMGGVAYTPHPTSGKAQAPNLSYPSPLAKGGGVGGGIDNPVLKDWIDTAHFCLKSNGSFTMIHRADKIDKIILGMGKRFGALEIIPLWPKAGQDAKRVIVRAIKDRKTPTSLKAGLILHNEDGSYTDRTEHILRELGTI